MLHGAATASALFLLCGALPAAAQVDPTQWYKVTVSGRNLVLSTASDIGSTTSYPVIETFSNSRQQWWKFTPERIRDAIGRDLYRMTNLSLGDGLSLTSGGPNPLSMEASNLTDAHQIWSILPDAAAGGFRITCVSPGSTFSLGAVTGSDKPTLLATETSTFQNWTLAVISPIDYSSIQQGQNSIARASVVNGAVDAANSYNPSGKAITASRDAKGKYSVAFDGVLSDSRHVLTPGLSNFQVQATGGADVYCGLSNSGEYDNTGSAVDGRAYMSVWCYDTQGTLADANFTAWWIPAGNGENISFTLGSADGTARPQHSYSTVQAAGIPAIRQRRASEGTYIVDFPNLGGLDTAAVQWRHGARDGGGGSGIAGFQQPFVCGNLLRQNRGPNQR